MALTLVEAAKLSSGQVKRSAVIEMFAQESDVLRVLPFDNIAGNAYSYSREETLPGIAFRGVNESYTESTGVVNPLTEALTISGGDLDVDRFIVNTQGMGVRSTHERMKVKALAQEWSRVFIKGDSTSNPREFDGLQTRLTGAQKVAAGNTANGDALSLIKLDEAIDATSGATHLLMSKAMRRRMTAAARNINVAGHITFQQDEFGRRVTVYNDLPILVPYNDNGGTEFLAFDEACPGGGTNTGTSLYVLGLGTGKLQGIQNSIMDVRDLGELETKPVLRTRVEWYAAIALLHGRAATRLWGVADAAVTA